VEQAGLAVRDKIAPTVSAALVEASHRLDGAAQQQQQRRRRWPRLVAGIAMLAAAASAVAAVILKRQAGLLHARRCPGARGPHLRLGPVTRGLHLRSGPAGRALRSLPGGLARVLGHRHYLRGRVESLLAGGPVLAVWVFLGRNRHFGPPEKIFP
jgi:hypothetical protein